MIEAVYDLKAQRLTVKGHAGYAEKGKDIVCAGVSTLVYMLIHSCDCEVYGDSIRVYDDPRVFDAVICGLEKISENYPKNLRLVPYRKDRSL